MTFHDMLKILCKEETCWISQKMLRGLAVANNRLQFLMELILQKAIMKFPA